ncbi:MAG: hypothetical protein M1834_003431 [Cirrosporium novae-zelandiae]|nr:MAG: hypothetical protein M1834_003431 [Cirrosporium novae-zelandiae]
MTIRTLDEWASNHVQTLPLAALKGTRIGIDATNYLEQYLSNPKYKEPLLPAHGGTLFGFRGVVEGNLNILRSFEITPVFVFNGMDFGKGETSLASFTTALQANAQAWDFYDRQQAEKVVEIFGSSDSIKPGHLHRALQKVLLNQNIAFQVAPYSALAQLAYLDKHSIQFVDAIAGSTELFIFDVDKVITKFDFDDSTFSWISRRSCIDDLRISNDFFVDVCLLAGSSILPTFPPLENPVFYPKGYGIREIVNMMHSLGRNVTGLVNHYQDDPQLGNSQYLDKYRRAFMAVKHHVVMTADGKVEPFDVEHAPSDVHEFIGQRLPDELYFYVFCGVLSPRVPNWLTSGRIVVQPPFDEANSEDYRKLVQDQLNPLRTQALSLLSNSLHRFYHSKEISIRCWFEDRIDRNDRVISLKGLPSLKNTIADWNVHSQLLDTQSRKINVPLRSLRFAVSSLADRDFAAKSITPKDTSHTLSTPDEIVCNTLWRFLQLRGYIDAKHELTKWGKALEAGLAAADPSDEFEEPLFLAIELMRLGLLSSRPFFPAYSGGAITGSDEDKRYCLLLSRVACLGTLEHQHVGYSGPLDRQLLAYLAMISAVRVALRDLVEVTLTTLLLNGDANRDRDDLNKLSLDLPFLDENNCLMGIAVRAYLDDLAGSETPTLPASKQVSIGKCKEWFQFANDISSSLNTAFRLWDAVCKSCETIGNESKEEGEWTQANKWLANRR